jgi:hypothetical protein
MFLILTHLQMHCGMTMLMQSNAEQETTKVYACFIVSVSLCACCCVCRHRRRDIMYLDDAGRYSAFWQHFTAQSSCAASCYPAAASAA